MRVVVIGDIGVVDDMIHIGDEAMFEALITALRVRGVDRITAVSAAPAETAARYSLDAVSPIGFGADQVANDARRELVLGAAAGRFMLEPGDPAADVIDAVRASDGVIIAGGGNMTSLWPHHIYERSTLGALAELFDVPLVVTGQTIGPDLSERDGMLVAELLSSARLVGVRESASLRLVHSLGVMAEQTIDDASYLDSSPAEAGDYCLVSLSNHVADHSRDAVASHVAELLDDLVASTGLSIRFLPHFGSLDASRPRGDSRMHDLVIAALKSPSTKVLPTDSLAAARLARGAAFIVSSRYHPVVFGVPAGVPALAIPVDEYTTVKLRGALTNFGQSGLLPVDALLAGDGQALAHRLWSRRRHIREDAAHHSHAHSHASELWWDRVADALAADELSDFAT